DRAGDFDRVYQPQPSLAQLAGLRRQTGGFELVRVETSDAERFAGLVREKDGDRIARVELALTAEQPVRLARFSLRPVPAPGDLA
ncbi:hypothetical protein, partial [Klebsiella pneumoniae]|uniref:hypothetical protein n=1 Tax=Klebsiella pneumoniae TaxID=573 RepID=UPI0013D66007